MEKSTKDLLIWAAVIAGVTFLVTLIVVMPCVKCMCGACIPGLQSRFGERVPGVGTNQASFIGPLMSFVATGCTPCSALFSIVAGLTAGIVYFSVKMIYNPKEKQKDTNRKEYEKSSDEKL
jgi:hypothetical protein